MVTKQQVKNDQEKENNFKKTTSSSFKIISWK